MILPFRMGPAASRSVLCDIDRVLLGVAKLRVKNWELPARIKYADILGSSIFIAIGITLSGLSIF